MTAVQLGSYELRIANDFGPRIVGLRRGDGPELLAQLGPGHAIEHSGGIYRFHGGHRLWAAPEDPGVTYANDDHACNVGVENGKATVLAPPDTAGLTKSVVVTGDGNGLLIQHTIIGETATRQLAAWAITQFPLGGTVIISLGGSDTGPRPNRNLVLWPYTRLDDPRLRFGDGAAMVTAGDGPPLKLGVGPSPQRLGYFRDGWLFTKEISSTPSGTMADLGAVSQVYLGQGFCELESLGELVDAGGRPASVSERWEVLACDDETTALSLVLEESA